VWLNTDVGTYTNEEGFFEIKRNLDYNDLVVRYIGYVTDTIYIPEDKNHIEITLKQYLELEGVEVSVKKQSQRIEKSSVTSTQTITSQGLKKAACCNLGESFQTNASVDVSYSDAVSGAKQIMLLGLQGKYTQMMTENIPNLRGAAIKYGLNYVPGPWMDEISISKGTSSVRNGFESITGQINVGFKQPPTSEKLYLNLYANRFGRFEANANSNYIISPNASTMLMVHGNLMQNAFDMNNDNFVDIPVVSQLNLFNRWNFHSDSWENKTGIKYLTEDRIGGQNTYVNDGNLGYGIDINTQRIEAFTKNGFFFGNHKSLGTILSFSHHDQNSNYGNNIFDIEHSSFYANFLFDTPLSSESHKISTGLSWQYDNYVQNFNQIDNSMEESVPGAFLEYVYTGLNNLTLTGGMRVDNHNNFGTFFTPRLHAKYQITDFTTLRASAGKGFRSPQVFAENTGIMVSSREFVIEEDLGMEEAWNFGLNFTTDFMIGNTYVTFNTDFYRTEFIQQVIVDLDQSVDKAVFYNLEGAESYANSLQFEFIIEPLQGLTLNTAYRWNDVMQTINGELMQKPLISPHKGFLNIEYETYNEAWNFDVTVEFVGSGRLPITEANPLEYQRPDFFDPYMLLHAQITKSFDTFDIYLGGENLTDFRQENQVFGILMDLLQ
jgi:outer membrane receptor protein involved in Fe transport